MKMRRTRSQTEMHMTPDEIIYLNRHIQHLHRSQSLPAMQDLAGLDILTALCSIPALIIPDNAVIYSVVETPRFLMAIGELCESRGK